MQTKTVLKAILATVAYIEAAQAVPMPQPSSPVAPWSHPVETLPIGVLDSVDLPTVTKRKTSIGSLPSSALKIGDFSGLGSGPEGILNDFADSHDSSSSDDSSASKRSSFIPTIPDGVESFADSDDSSSSSRRSLASLLEKVEPYLESAAKTAGSAAGSQVVSAGQSLASDDGLSKRKIKWGDIVESGGSATASALGDGLGSTVASDIQALESDVARKEKRSETLDAELPKRSGFWTKVEHGLEDLAPIAVSALSDAKRDTAARSSVDEFESFLNNLENKGDRIEERQSWA